MFLRTESVNAVARRQNSGPRSDEDVHSGSTDQWSNEQTVRHMRADLGGSARRAVSRPFVISPCGGAVIANAAVGLANVETLVYIAAVALDNGESPAQLVTIALAFRSCPRRSQRAIPGCRRLHPYRHVLDRLLLHRTSDVRRGVREVAPMGWHGVPFDPQVRFSVKPARPGTHSGSCSRRCSARCSRSRPSPSTIADP